MNKQEAMKQAAIEFSTGTPIQEVMKKYNVCYASVYNALRRFNIPYLKTNGRRVFFDESFFKSINTEEKAYWLGFIMSDGNLSTSDKSCLAPNRLSISASERDKQHLYTFMNTIRHAGKLLSQNREESYSTIPIYHLYCNSKKMCSDLIKHGCFPAKTGYSTFPKLSANLVNHFIRGYFDGDGCLSIYMSNGKGGVYKGKQYYCVPHMRCEFSITSDQNILSEIQCILADNCGLNITKLKEYKHTQKAVSLRYGGPVQVKRICEYIYNNATVYLPRKYDKYQLLLSQ